VLQDLQDQLVLRAVTALWVLSEVPELMETRAHPARRVLRDNPAPRDLRELRARQEQSGTTDLQDYLDHLELQVCRERLDSRDSLERRVHSDLPEIPEHRVRRGSRVPWDVLEQLDQLAELVTPVLMVPLVWLVLLVPRAHQDLKDKSVTSGSRDRTALQDPMVCRVLKDELERLEDQVLPGLQDHW